MIGIAARSGIALGINLQKKNVELDVNSGEARKQLWWSIFHLEHLLSVMTGRVSCLWDTSSSAPPPLASPSITHTGPDIDQPMSEPPGRINDIQWTMYLDQEQVESQRTLLESITPSPSLYFFYMVDLSLISHAISNGVYATDSPRIGWARVEGRIALYSKKVDRWVLSLHPSFCFQDSYDNPLPRSRSPFQISLALNYYSARIVLNRPCLNRPAIEKTSGSRIARSRSGNISALACLQASLAVMALLPDQPNLAWCYEILQWWNLLHVLTQATVILLLDVSIGPVPTRSEEAAVPAESAEDVLDGVKKGLSWLHCLGRSSEAARRAFEFCNSCIRRIATTKDLDLGGIPSAHGPSRTFRDSAEGNKAASQQEIQAVALPEHSKPAGPARSLYAGTSYDILFQDPQEGFAGSPGNASAVYDAGIDMSEFISRPAHAEIEEILRTMMGYNA